MRMTASLFCALSVAGVCLLGAGNCGQGRAQSRSTRSLASWQKSYSLTGTYTRRKRHKDENQSAILQVKQIRSDRIRFHLTALWWSTGGDSPHNGEIEATVALHDQVALYQNDGYRLRLRFGERQVVLTESGSNPNFGAYVRAAGTYGRTSRGSALRVRAGAR